MDLGLNVLVNRILIFYGCEVDPHLDPRLELVFHFNFFLL